MKIERFLKWIQNKLINYPDIDFSTVKMFIQEFNKCLSKKERERWQVPIQLIQEFSLKQITINESVKRIKETGLSQAINRVEKAYKVKRGVPK